MSELGRHRHGGHRHRHYGGGGGWGGWGGPPYPYYYPYPYWIDPMGIDPVVSLSLPVEEEEPVGMVGLETINSDVPVLAPWGYPYSLPEAMDPASGTDPYAMEPANWLSGMGDLGCGKDCPCAPCKKANGMGAVDVQSKFTTPIIIAMAVMIGLCYLKKK